MSQKQESCCYVVANCRHYRYHAAYRACSACEGLHSCVCVCVCLESLPNKEGGRERVHCTMSQ